jgi:uncharacterized protein YjbI with pentapeptide repeats
MRKSLEATWKHLEARGRFMPRTGDGRPFIPPGMPNYEDEELGVSFFKGGTEDADYSNLSLPRTFFGRSGFERVSFVNTDLSESRMCWNDFDDCDFSDADLLDCDMRASSFRRCKFTNARLLGADLRRSWFEDCEFHGAYLTGAKIVPEAGTTCIEDYLTSQQTATVAWEDDHGPEPPGG